MQWSRMFILTNCHAGQGVLKKLQSYIMGSNCTQTLRAKFPLISTNLNKSQVSHLTLHMRDFPPDPFPQIFTLSELHVLGKKKKNNIQRASFKNSSQRQQCLVFVSGLRTISLRRVWFTTLLKEVTFPKKKKLNFSYSPFLFYCRNES